MNKTLISENQIYYAETSSIYIEDPDFPTGKSTEEFKGIIFKDSLILSGCKLERLPDIMTKYSNKCHKMTGCLDYDLIHHSKTPLTQKEWSYNICDVILLNWYLREQQEYYDNNITHIPSTKTRALKNECKDRLFYSDAKKLKSDRQRKQHHDLMMRMRFNYSIYQQLRRAFQGGFTHANFNNAGKVLVNKVMSADLASAYPAACFKKYPMEAFRTVNVEKITDEDFDDFIANYACMFDVKLCDVSPRVEENEDFDLIENIISMNKVFEYAEDYPDCEPVFRGDAQSWFNNNNGRLRHAEEIWLTVTEQDWISICEFYDFDFDKIEIANFRIAKKDYLPKSLLLFLLELFRIKTSYKKYDGKDCPEAILYKRSKEFINSVYGMIAQNILTENWHFKNEKGVNIAVSEFDDLRKKVLKENKGKSRREINQILASKINKQLDQKLEERFDYGLEHDTIFLCYNWAPWITAYVRRTIFSIIAEGSKHNHVYTDTDSEKFIMNEDTMRFIKEYNAQVDKEMNECFASLGLDKDLHKVPYEDKDGNIKGVKCLGHFEIENDGKPYRVFCTVGAKKYLTMTDDFELHLTVAGLNKKSVDYLAKQYGKFGVFEHFKKGDVIVPKEYTGKLAATYNNYSNKGIVVDYKGNETKFAEESSIHLEKVSFDMHITEAYEKLMSEGNIWEAL